MERDKMKVSLIQFKKAGKRYHFKPDGLELNINDQVVVETIRGLEIGTVVDFADVEEKDLFSDLKPVIRVATEEDLLDKQQNNNDVLEIVVTTKDLVKKHNLEMSILDAEYTLDRKKLLIYFEAESRIDFRDLVKDLSTIYSTRIELRQVGSRDGAKLVGGIGPCGLILCCTTFLGDFETITIRMAKNQNMSLNPSKISGICDKLLCCIKYENEAYTHLKKVMPDIGDKVKHEGNVYDIKDINLLRERVLVFIGDDHERRWLKKGEYERVK